MNKKILITGIGMVSRYLHKKLAKKNYEVVFLSTSRSSYPYFYWNPEKNEIDEKALEGVSVIFHLAGAGIANKRWTKKRKQEIIDSRVKSAQLILQTLKKQKHTVEQFISASAVGYYGAVTTDKIFKENDPAANDFLGHTCKLWEEAAFQFKKVNVASTVSVHRFGIIFDQKEGAFPKIKQPFKWKLAVVLGSGKQWLPWVDIEDVVHQLIFAMENHLSGVYDCVVDVEHQVNYETLIEKLSVKYKPLFNIKIPAFLLKWILGEMAVILLEGSRVENNKIKQQRFTYMHKNILNY